MLWDSGNLCGVEAIEQGKGGGGGGSSWFVSEGGLQVELYYQLYY